LSPAAVGRYQDSPDIELTNGWAARVPVMPIEKCPGGPQAGAPGDRWGPGDGPR
jgi:hypothetical protein